MKKIIIDGVNYIQENSSLTDYRIFRCDRSGVFFGKVKKQHGQHLIMSNVRWIWWWEGAASLAQLAMEGVKKPDRCKFPCEIPELEVEDYIMSIPCTEEAVKSIQSVPVWEVK